MGVTPDRAAAEGVKGAAAGVHARDRLQPQLRARPAVSFAAKQDGQLDDAERERALRETRRRILESTERRARSRSARRRSGGGARSPTRSSARRRGGTPTAGRRSRSRRARARRSSSSRCSRRPTCRRRSAPRRRSARCGSPGTPRRRRAARRRLAAPFDLSTSVDRFHAMEQRLRERALFRATWNFLDDIEMEFAATLLLQSWARRVVLYSRQPPPRVPHERHLARQGARRRRQGRGPRRRREEGVRRRAAAPGRVRRRGDQALRPPARDGGSRAPRLALPTSTSPAPPAKEPAAAPAPVVDAPPPADDDAPSSPRAFVHGLAREALARLLLDAPDGVFKDRRSGFAFARGLPAGPRGGGRRRAAVLARGIAAEDGGRLGLDDARRGRTAPGPVLRAHGAAGRRLAGRPRTTPGQGVVSRLGSPRCFPCRRTRRANSNF